MERIEMLSRNQYLKYRGKELKDRIKKRRPKQRKKRKEAYDGQVKAAIATFSFSARGG